MIKISPKTILILFAVSVNLGTLNAQDKSKKLTNDLNALIENSNGFKEYKVIKKESITNFQASLNSYIKQEQSIQMNLENEIKANEKEINTLEIEMKKFKTSNEQLMNEKSSIGFLGFSISKENYSLTMWILFLGALAAAIILFLSFKRSNKITRESKKVLADLEEEYQSFKGMSVEREQNLRRQLFDEVKKAKDLKNS